MMREEIDREEHTRLVLGGTAVAYNEFKPDELSYDIRLKHYHENNMLRKLAEFRKLVDKRLRLDPLYLRSNMPAPFMPRSI